MKEGKKRFSLINESMEFVFPNEYCKMFRPVFSGEFDFDAKEENGIITIILKPASKENSTASPLEYKKIPTFQESTR
jgi:hypothetical protein